MNKTEALAHYTSSVVAITTAQNAVEAIRAPFTPERIIARAAAREALAAAKQARWDARIAAEAAGAEGDEIRAAERTAPQPVVGTAPRRQCCPGCGLGGFDFDSCPNCG